VISRVPVCRDLGAGRRERRAAPGAAGPAGTPRDDGGRLHIPDMLAGEILQNYRMPGFLPGLRAIS